VGESGDDAGAYAPPVIGSSYLPQGNPPQPLSFHSTDDLFTVQFLVRFNGALVELTQTAADRRHVRQNAQSQSQNPLDQWVVLIKLQVAQLSKPQQKMHNCQW
jgi:hypothetical protein